MFILLNKLNILRMQNDLDRMQLPSSIRWRIQSAMPVLLPSVRWFFSCHLSSVPVVAVASLQPSITISGFHSGNPSQKNPLPLARTAMNVPGKSRPLPLQQENDMEIDPWTLLEDGTGSGPSLSNTAVIGSGDHPHLRATSWLKGAVRARRTDLTYIGAVDDDSWLKLTFILGLAWSHQFPRQVTILFVMRIWHQASTLFLPFLPLIARGAVRDACSPCEGSEDALHNLLCQVSDSRASWLLTFWSPPIWMVYSRCSWSFVVYMEIINIFFYFTDSLESNLSGIICIYFMCINLLLHPLYLCHLFGTWICARMHIHWCEGASDGLIHDGSECSESAYYLLH